MHMHLQHINYCIVNKYVSIDVHYAIIYMFVNIIGNTVFEPRLVLVIDPATLSTPSNVLVDGCMSASVLVINS